MHWFDRFFITLGGKLADPQNPEEKSILNMLARVSEQQHCSPPHLILYKGHYIGAGSNPISGSIYLEQGIIKALPPEQLEAALAHEVAHHKHINRDIFIKMTMFIGAGIAYWKGIKPKVQNYLYSGGKGFVAEGIIDPLLAATTFTILKSPISKAIEFEADRESSIASEKPLDLANALENSEKIMLAQDEKIEALKRTHEPSSITTIKDTIAQIPPPSIKNFIIDVMKKHPDIKSRVARLKAMDEMNKIASHESQR